MDSTRNEPIFLAIAHCLYYHVESAFAQSKIPQMPLQRLAGEMHGLFIIINANIKTAADRAMNRPINMSKWYISNNTNWKKYQASIFGCFANWNSDSSSNVNEMSSFKS